MALADRARHFTPLTTRRCYGPNRSLEHINLPDPDAFRYEIRHHDDDPLPAYIVHAQSLEDAYEYLFHFLGFEGNATIGDDLYVTNEAGDSEWC